MTSLPLSICIVLYRSEEVTKRFIDDLRVSLRGFIDFEVLVYDNSPTDAMRSFFVEEAYIHDSTNAGFSFANNQLILRAASPSILLLNPDVFGITQEFWRRLSELVGQDRVTFIKLLNVDGSHQDCVGEPASFGRALRPQRYDTLTEPTRVGVGIMAFMLTTKNVFAKVGLLDCDYPLYGEDMDWSFRANRHGIEVWYDPTLSVTHIGGTSSRDRWSHAQSLTRKYRADNIFINKHARGLRWLGLRLLTQVKLLKANLA